MNKTAIYPSRSNNTTIAQQICIVAQMDIDSSGRWCQLLLC